VACYTLRCAADHIEATPLAELEQNPGYLEGLTAHEKQQESRLVGEVAQYYRRPDGRGDAASVSMGGLRRLG
jgi:hypothetical protein